MSADLERVPKELRDECDELLPMARAVLSATRELVRRYRTLDNAWNSTLTLHPSLAETGEPGDNLDGEMLNRWTGEIDVLIYAIGNVAHYGDSPMPNQYERYGITGNAADDTCSFFDVLEEVVQGHGEQPIVDIVRHIASR